MPPPATSPARLTLVGTVHRDPQGEGKLLRLLEELRPEAVTVEVSAAALAYREGRSRLLQLRLEGILKRLAGELGTAEEDLFRHPVAADIRALLEIPFEYRAARSYGEASGAEVAAVDLDEISSAKLQRVERELITHRNLRVLLNLPGGNPPRLAGEDYRLAEALLAERVGASLRHAFLARRRGEEGIGRRDRRMAAAIRRLLAARPSGRLVHVGGWVHLVEDPRGETLFSLLGDLAPVRRLLV